MKALRFRKCGGRVLVAGGALLVALLVEDQDLQLLFPHKYSPSLQILYETFAPGS